MSCGGYVTSLLVLVFTSCCTKLALAGRENKLAFLPDKAFQGTCTWWFVAWAKTEGAENLLIGCLLTAKCPLCPLG
uniref:Uncharacterized protein n=1 Tax=Anguilla anguilla TaxID=7936 RepID=A0A0E9W9Y1_ANGAN